MLGPLASFFVLAAFGSGDRRPFFVETLAHTIGVGRQAPARTIERAAEIEPRASDPGAPRALLLTPSAGAPATFESNILVPSQPFREALLSWNVDCPATGGFRFEMRVADDDGSAWSPWLHVGEWGRTSEESVTTQCALGKVDVDAFAGARPLERLQWRIRARGEEGAPLRVVRVAACFSDREQRLDPRPDASLARAHRIDVPYRSQKAERKEIAGRICSPTSVAMVLARHGIDAAVERVAELAYDARYEIYGNWPCNVQAAFALGLPGYVTRFQTWREVEEWIARGEPLVISIAVKKGQLSGAPYETSAGHLLVVTGFDARGDVHVNDPAARDATHGQVTYARAELDVVWLERGGVAYALSPRLAHER